jgi:type IV pilus assembly protein PilX
MSTDKLRKPQQGVALVVALLFLLVVTIISVIAASNSSISLKMSANLADNYSSFQAAEAGIIAVLSLAGTTNDPFDGDDTADPFAAFGSSDHPLRDLSDGEDSVDADVFLTTAATTCPTENAATASSAPLYDCEFYRVDAEHEVPKEARTKVELGVVKKIIGAGAQ